MTKAERAEYQHHYYLQHREYIRARQSAYHKIYYRKNRDRERALSKKYYWEHREQCMAKAREYRQKRKGGNTNAS